MNKFSLSGVDLTIERFGGMRKLAEMSNVPYTTVSGWRRRDVIPTNMLKIILLIAKKNNINLTAEEILCGEVTEL